MKLFIFKQNQKWYRVVYIFFLLSSANIQAVKYLNSNDIALIHIFWWQFWMKTVYFSKILIKSLHVEYILRSSYFINFIFQCNASHFTYSTEYFGWYILCVKYIILLLNFGGNCNVTMIQCISIYICSMKSSMKKKHI